MLGEAKTTLVGAKNYINDSVNEPWWEDDDNVELVPRHQIPVLTLGVWAAIETYVSYKPSIRQIGVRPFDLFNHVGNLASAALVSTWISDASAMAYSAAADLLDLSPSARRLRGMALATGIGVAAVLNALVETKYGSDHSRWLFDKPVPDNIDLIYGIVGAALGGFTLRISDPARRAQRTTQRQDAGLELQMNSPQVLAGWM